MAILELPKPRQLSVAERPVGAPAMLVPFPLSRTPTARAIAAEMLQHTRRQAPARKILREALKARAKELRGLGVDADAIAQDALLFAQAVHALLPRKRVAGAADQVATRIAARIGERTAAAAPLPAMPRPTPPEPHFRIRWPAKVRLHPTFHDQRAVERHVDGLMRMTPDGAEQHILRNLAAIGRLIEGMGIDDETTIAKFTRNFEGRVRAEIWRRVLLSDPPQGKPLHDDD